MLALKSFDFTEEIILENERVLLRPLRISDGSLLSHYVKEEPDLWQYSLVAIHNSEDLDNYIQSAIDARGIDVDELAYVVNYEIPNIPETYVHRIGRTGRAGAGGTAISFCDAEERAFLKDIEKLIASKIILPTWFWATKMSFLTTIGHSLRPSMSRVTPSLLFSFFNGIKVGHGKGMILYNGYLFCN